MTNQHATTRNRNRYQRRALGAVMVETVLIMPFIALSLVLIVYLGWNFRRLAQVTNMDRYAVWEAATPGSPGPDNRTAQGQAIFGLNGDEPVSLAGLAPGNNVGVRYLPEGHAELRDQQADETFSYFDDFLDRNPAGLRQRFQATHNQNSINTNALGLSDVTRNGEGHSRLNGEWRYVNGIRRGGSDWEPGFRRVSPGESLRDVFFINLDQGLQPFIDNGNPLANAIQDFYFFYPTYQGPDVRF